MSDNWSVPHPQTDQRDHVPAAPGDVLMRRRRWAEAAAAFEDVARRDPATEMKRRLSLNLASLERHRPEVYATLLALPAQRQYAIATTASGQPTVVRRGADGSVTSLSSGNDPLGAAASAKQQIHDATKSGEAVGLCGIGDGYLVQVLAHNPPALFMDKAQPVFVIEPEPHVALQCLMIHDYSGPRGPIEQARFGWFVGDGWERRLEETLLADLFLPGPSLLVGQGGSDASIQPRVREIIQKLADLDARLAAQVDAYYASVGADFTTTGSRRPRVLLLTTRFSTVLQFSTSDTAAAFERLGWDARVVIEPSSHHRVLRTAIRDALGRFKPDLVFQIDHLRHEHNGLFPAALPFACWVQDHLPHLATTDAGSRVGPLDFVLTDATATYVDKFGYPARQCVALPKLTADALPLPPGQGRGEGASKSVTEPALEIPLTPTLSRGERQNCDIVFVSNASQTPAAMVAQAVATYGQTEASRELVTLCCDRMATVYASGGSLPTYGDVCAVLGETLGDLRLKLPVDDFDRLARWLTHPFNDALYRQQALRWAAGSAGELGLTLALYGNGWENHPEFAPFARGPVAYGQPLADLTRRSRINLQVVPYLCLHQRLLDGLMAGGFFLVRTHPADVAPAALLDFLDANVDASVRTTPATAASLPPPLKAEFEALLSACRPGLCTTGLEDVVTMVRDWQNAGQLVPGEGPLPMLAETSFHDAASFTERLRRFAGDPSLRGEVSRAQRGSVARRLTYDAGIGRVVGRMRQLLRESNDSARNEPRLKAA